MKSFFAAITALLLTIALPWRSAAIEPISERIVVLTFDDSVVSHATFVAPLLKKHGFCTVA